MTILPWLYIEKSLEAPGRLSWYFASMIIEWGISCGLFEGREQPHLITQEKDIKFGMCRCC